MSVQSGPYQSRILGLLNRQKLRWGGRMGVVLRQFKQTAIWSVQVALYPLYVLFQSARMVSSQMGQAVAFALPRLKAAVRESATAQSPNQSTSPTIWPDQLTIDTPLQQILLTVKSFGLPFQLAITCPPPIPESSEPKAFPLSFRCWVSLTHSHPAAIAAPGGQVGETVGDWIRGVASCLETRSLVLVTNHNQVLNVLTPEQQTRLRQRIVWEVAHLARYQKLRAKTRRAFNRLQPERTHLHLLPPVRWFYRLMAWIQSSPIAIATNLFQEASLPAPTPNLRLIGARELAQTVGAIQRVNQASAWPTQIVQTVQSVIATLQPQPSITRQATNALEAVALKADGAILQTYPQATPSPPSYRPNYIEAEATCIGYERSVLTRILYGLDQALVWLEAQLLKGWQQVQQWLLNLRSNP
ncbi:MAG: hypothetical protein ACKO24_11045 [Leptolyngbyaceae cyanobacterium]